MKEKREKEKRRLKVLNAEISLLEKEKEMNSNAMIEIENKKEIKKRARIKKKKDEEKDLKINKKITPALIKSLNHMMFEISNLPLEYILAQSNKMVLTSEWHLSIVERECLKKYTKIKDLFKSKLLLEEKRNTAFSGFELKRRKILRASADRRKTVLAIQRGLLSAGEPQSVADSISQEYSYAEPGDAEALSEKYKSVLCLFSLMKSNKSNIRYTVPQSKKNPVMHSSHTTCLDKIKIEPGKIFTIPDLVRYRMYRRSMREGEKPGAQKGPGKDPEKEAAQERSEDVLALEVPGSEGEEGEEEKL
ncbi:uncharacterized protein NEMAJ01_1467 [Nematocida major]|uniref:uncharacterized protein n=1 Tax=Nematocida major TaxID=1912982 RepID=UPI002007781D|nr:uncharacterized protein NEMAJ01_1467 [Nematocida major]KAH9386571.1 hypothetical protein NEMAJ01_1467 [Nematocida major]